MTLFDYLALFIMTCSILIGVMRGLVKEVLSLLGWVLGLIVANAFCHEVAAMLTAIVPGEIMRLMIAFVALFVGVKLLLWLLGMTLEAMLEATGLSPLDRLLGSVFGVARGVVIVLTVVLLCGMTAIPRQDFWRNAMFSASAETAAQAALPYLPGGLIKHVHFPQTVPGLSAGFAIGFNFV